MRKNIADHFEGDEALTPTLDESEVIAAMCVGSLTRRKMNIVIAVRSLYLPPLRKYWPSTIAGTGSWAKALRAEIVCILEAFS
jgi:hypothetical protein